MSRGQRREGDLGETRGGRRASPLDAGLGGGVGGGRIVPQQNVCGRMFFWHYGYEGDEHTVVASEVGGGLKEQVLPPRRIKLVGKVLSPHMCAREDTA